VEIAIRRAYAAVWTNKAAPEVVGVGGAVERRSRSRAGLLCQKIAACVCSGVHFEHQIGGSNSGEDPLSLGRPWRD
jgi:hypothetical protein